MATFALNVVYFGTSNQNDSPEILSTQAMRLHEIENNEAK